jgi:hypothetical protein
MMRQLQTGIAGEGNEYRPAQINKIIHIFIHMVLPASADGNVIHVVNVTTVLF